MIESGYYPTGAEHDSDAPYNQASDEDRCSAPCLIEACYVCKTQAWVICDVDEDGDALDLVGAYEHSCMRPDEIFQAVGNLLSRMMPHARPIAHCMDIDPNYLLAQLRLLQGQCGGWQCEADDDYFDQHKPNTKPS